MAKKREPLLFLGDISKAIQKIDQIGEAIIEMRDLMYPSLSSLA